MQNGTCDCSPFYSGAACETYKGCPTELDSSVCEDIISSNLIQTDNLGFTSSPESDSTSSTDEENNNSGNGDNLPVKDTLPVEDTKANNDGKDGIIINNLRR